MSVRFVFWILFAQGLAGCANLTTQFQATEPVDTSESVAVSQSQMRNACRHIERDLTQPWAQRSYWCVPESIAASDYVVNSNDHPVLPIRKPYDTSTELFNDRENSNAKSFISESTETGYSTAGVTNSSLELKPCIEKAQSEYEAPVRDVTSENAVAASSDITSQSTSGSSFNTDSHTREVEQTTDADESDLEFDAPAFSTVTFNPPINPLTDFVTREESSGVGMTVSVESPADVLLDN